MLNRKQSSFKLGDLAPLEPGASAATGGSSSSPTQPAPSQQQQQQQQASPSLQPPPTPVLANAESHQQQTGGGPGAADAAAAAAAAAYGLLGPDLAAPTALVGGPNAASFRGPAGKLGWFDKSSVRHFMRACSIASLISVCANTSKTFSHYPHLILITFVVDLVSCAVFTLEMVLKIYQRKLLDGPNPYARDRWCQFDASMVLFLWVSILLQVFEIFHIVGPYSVLSVLRSPRPLILVRFIRVFFKFSMPKTRIKQIFKRSSQQIYNVTLFFLFFMILYGLLGVQLFGQIEKHCVVEGTELADLTVNSLAIPDTHCSGSEHYGNQCPPGMVCMDLHLPKEIVGYNGFDHIGHSLYTVYQTSSQEGWSHLMYSTFDHYPAWKVAAYFVSLIFFLGWMVRNVFIAVFTETFNEIRVQFQQMWGERQALAGEGVPMVFRGDDSGWRLVEADDQQATSHWVPQLARRFQNSATFQVLVLLAILANVILSASIKFEHDGRAREQFYMHFYWWEVGFTLFFNLEALYKIACLGFACYWTRMSHRFELFLAIGCSFQVVIPGLFMTELADFQVLRVIRLIKASPVLEDFAYKSFGPGRKLGSLIMFTVCLLVVTSAMTMQLFCSLSEYHRFENFPYAFMSMFQILTQEAWTDVMNETMLRVRDHIGPYVAVYFIMYHLFVSLIVLSLFVAVILDNLELPEDLKKAKQEKAREQIACISEELPLRLRVFEHFPDSPQMTKLDKLASDAFNVPKVRESFMRQFVQDSDQHCTTIKNCLRAGLMPASGIDYATLNATADHHHHHHHHHQYQTVTSAVRHSLKSKLRPGSTTTATTTASTPTTAGPDGKLQLTRGKQRRAPAATRQMICLGAGAEGAAAAAAAATEVPVAVGGPNQRPRGAMIRVPSIKLLTTPARKSAKNELLRKSTISQLIEESNLQRMSLMSDEFVLGVIASGGGGARSSQQQTALTRDTSQQLLHQQQQQQQQLQSRGGGGAATAGGGGGGGREQQLRFRGERLGSMTPKIHQSYDYLRSENGLHEGSASNAVAGGGGAGVGVGENLRNPQDLNIKMLKRKRQQAELKRSQREKDLRENHPLFDTPLFLVGRESKFRKFCQMIAWAKYQYNDRNPITGKLRKSQYKSLHNLLGLVSYFDWLMIVITTMSCISMMFETPTMRVMNTPALQVAEYIFVAAMTIELTLKTLANGLVFTPRALLSTVSGVLDTFILISSLAYALWMPQEVESQSLAQFLMLLRCVRPLRVFSLIPHMRQVVYELVRGFKAIFLVCILLGLLCFVFACYGVHIFGGRLARCTDPTISDRANCTGTFLRKVFVTKMRVPTDDQTYPALLVPRVWANPHRFSFDDIKSAMLALFEVLSFKGWVDIREALLKRFEDSPHWLYIHIFVFFGCMVGVTLFVGVVIANYGENKGTALLTVDQRRWCDLKKRLKIARPLHLPPRPDHVKFRAIIYDIIQHILFKRMIAFLVLCNSSLLIVHWNPNEEHTLSFATISACLTVAFTLEVIMRMIAFAPHGYWQSRRNRYDLAVTLIGCIWVLVHFLLTNNTWSNSFGFIVVILRFFTITGKHATLQMLMLTVVVSVYKSFFIILGLFVLVLFYSLLGVQLFGSVKYGENLSRQANFRSAKLGTITMFRIVTGEDWYRMMHDCMIGPPYCTKGKNYWDTDCGHFEISFAFFSSFYIIITHIVLNLLVAIIMENFSLFYSSEEDALLSYTDIRNFQNTWNMVDAQQRGSIPVRRVKFVLRLLKGRLEVDPTRDQHLIKHMCHEMERLHNGDDVSFHDVLSMLSYRSVDINKSLQFEELLARNELESIIEEEVAKKTIRSWLDQCLRRVKQQRQQNSLIQGLRLTNMGGADLFLPAPAGATAGEPTSAPPSGSVGAAGKASAAGLLSTSSDHSPQTPRAQPTGSIFGALTSGGGGAGPSSSFRSATTSGSNEGTGRQPSCSTSESQHSITSAATIATIAASIGKLKRRVEASRSESVSTGAGGTGGGGGGGASGGASGSGSTSLGQRKLLGSQGADQRKEDRAQQLRRAIKALTNPATSKAATSAVAAGFMLNRNPEIQRQSPPDEEEALLKQQYRPKLNSAINDIHRWWEVQIN